MGLVETVELSRPSELGPVHFIAIGGSGMNGIAMAFRQLGIEVSGSDRQDSATCGRWSARAPGSTSVTGPSSSARPAPSLPPPPSAKTTRSWPRRAAAACGCCIAVRPSAR